MKFGLTIAMLFTAFVLRAQSTTNITHGDIEWTLKDATDAFTSCRSVYATETDTTNINAAFLSVTDFSNYTFLTDDIHTVSQKMADVSIIMANASDLGKIFYSKGLDATVHIKYDVQIARLFQFICSLSVVSSQLAQQFEMDNPAMSSLQRRGMEQFQHGLVEILNGILVSCTLEKSFYSEESICTLLLSANNLYAAMKVRLDEITDATLQSKFKYANTTNNCGYNK